MPDAPLPPLPPPGQPPWRTAVDGALARVRVRPGALPASTARIGAVAALVGAVVVGMLVLARPAAQAGRADLPMAVPAPPEPAGSPGPSGSPGSAPVPAQLAAAGGPGADGPEEVVVDVAGAVARPGLVRLRAGSRVADALTAGGGPAADADLGTLNQARVVADGEQVRVPRVGEPPPPPPPAAATGAAPAPGPAMPVDLNRGTSAELDTLPGVGPATATAIIAWRDENGGFRRVDDLLEVPGIGPTRLERLRPHVRV